LLDLLDQREDLVLRAVSERTDHPGKMVFPGRQDYWDQVARQGVQDHLDQADPPDLPGFLVLLALQVGQGLRGPRGRVVP